MNEVLKKLTKSRGLGLGTIFAILYVVPQIPVFTVVARDRMDMARLYPWVDMDKAYFVQEKQRMYYHYAPMDSVVALIFACSVIGIVYALSNFFGEKP